jgi:HupE / UreJ protein
MSEFNLYFKLGIEHILTWEALDHILFVTALCLRYRWADWKKVAILVTAFTIGHSATLALSALQIINASISWIEFLIPLTIGITALNNILQKKNAVASKLPVIYFLALFFGMIHGMAYASTFLELEGRDGLISHLFAFNLGIEAAQLLVVAVVLFISFIFADLLKIPRVAWIKGVSVIILVFSLKMAIERIPRSTVTSTSSLETIFSTYCLSLINKVNFLTC